jgi:hypothetical protein
MGTQNIPGPNSGAGSVAPRVTPDAIANEIVSVRYINAAEAAIAKGQPADASLELLTLCILTLRNGFTVVGKSACASPENYDESIGQTVAYGDAIRQIWPLLGYELKSNLALAARIGLEHGATHDGLGEALTHMIAHRLGNPEAFKPEHAEVILAFFDSSVGDIQD